MSNALNQLFPTLRYEPSTKWIRAWCGESLVLDSRAAMLVWEPMRITPVYAVPESEVLAELRVSSVGSVRPAEGRVLSPDDAFIGHTAAGTVLDVVLGGTVLEAAAYRFDDAELSGLIEFDFWALDWREENESIFAHPRDPFHRVDFRASGRSVRIDLDGTALASSARPTLVFETYLPERYYLPPEDVNWEALEPSESTSMCPYKGTANYWRVRGSQTDIAWSYARPVSDAQQLAGLVSFYNERVDLSVDGIARSRPRTPFG